MHLPSLSLSQLQLLPCDDITAADDDNDTGITTAAATTDAEVRRWAVAVEKVAARP